MMHPRSKNMVITLKFYFVVFFFFSFTLTNDLPSVPPMAFSVMLCYVMLFLFWYIWTKRQHHWQNCEFCNSPVCADVVNLSMFFFSPPTLQALTSGPLFAVVIVQGASRKYNVILVCCTEWKITALPIVHKEVTVTVTSFSFTCS